jgi:hypothetical protein
MRGSEKERVVERVLRRKSRKRRVGMEESCRRWS